MVNNEKSLLEEISLVKEAQRIYSQYSQEQVDKIFYEAAKAANEQRIPLAQMAVEETGMGLVEDKVIKNQFASEFIYNKYKDQKTVGVIDSDDAMGYEKIAEPIGMISAVIPTTNPTSTAIFKVLIALKTRNSIFLAPHPRARKSTIAAAEVVINAAIKAGAPKNLLGYISEVEKGVDAIGLTNLLMKNSDLILATGGPGMVQAAYSSGKPAIGVGAGNTAALIEKSADIEMAVSSILVSKSFDYGVICASEQSVIIDQKIYKQTMTEFTKRGAYVLNKKELEKVRNIILTNGKLNASIVGQSPQEIAKIAGISVPSWTRIIIGEVTDPTLAEPFAHEKLSVILAAYQSKNFDDALEISQTLINHSGIGHTSSIFANEITAKEEISKFSSLMKTSRILVNTPSSQGGIGDIYNFALEPSLTLGCGSWGGNSVSENVGPKHLLNIKTVAKRRENMLWMQLPEKVYYKYGSLEVGLSDIVDSGIKKVTIITDEALFKLNLHEKMEKMFQKNNIQVSTFFDIQPDPTIENVQKGVEHLNIFQPEAIIAFGGGSAIDAGKIIWLMYEDENANFKDMSTTFMDIRKRIYKFPKLGKKAQFVAVPTTSGTGSEVTPFSVITDTDGTKYPIADYSLTPNIAIVDPELTMSMPKSLTIASGVDVFTHAIESYVSVLATDYTKPYSLQAAKLVSENLVKSVSGGNTAKIEKENMANASCLAGIAFGNAFLGICHSLAHKLGAKFHIPHGVANALLLNEVIKFNATDKPYRQGVFSQYKKPESLKRYAEFANYLGINGKNEKDEVEQLVNFFNVMKKDLEIPTSIQEWGVSETDFLSAVDELAVRAFDDQCTGANPRYPQISDLKEIYLRAFYGNKYQNEETYNIGE